MPSPLTPVRYRAAFLCIFFLFLGTFAIPRYIPVVPTISLSYMIGFNNRAAVVLFLLGALGTVVALRGWIGAADEEDSRLPGFLLPLSVAVTGALCLLLRLHRAHKVIGGEAYYLLDRQRLLDLGKIPYKDFEFAYGPLLLYPQHFLDSAFHLHAITSYSIVWLFYWCVGTTMFYYVVQHVDIATRHRFAIYALVMIVIPSALMDEGINYTPLRAATSPFLAILLYQYWRMTKAPYQTALVAVLAVAIGFGISAEQGVGLFLGISTYFLLLALRSRDWPLPAALLQLSLSSFVVTLVWRQGMLRTMQAFSLGGYNFPVLPSPVNLGVLTVYVCAIALLWKAFLQRNLNSSYVLLALCGIFMLPAAMGRCDTGHLIGATGLYLVGLFALHSRFSSWRILIVALWLLLPISFYNRWLIAGYHKLKGVPAPATASYNTGNTQPIASDRTYYSPYANSASPELLGFLPFSVDEGYYSGMENLTTSQQVANKLQELRDHRGMPLVLPDQPDATIPDVWDTKPEILRLLELYPVTPAISRPTLSTQILTDYISQHYRPTDMAEYGRRVWEFVPEN